MYGKELILDLHECDVKKMTRPYIREYFEQLCEKIDMKRCDLHFWDDEGVAEEDKQTSPHTTGVSAVQFILTSNITIHTLSLLKKVFINVFSCKEFDAPLVRIFSKEWFGGYIANWRGVDRL